MKKCILCPRVPRTEDYDQCKTCGYKFAYCSRIECSNLIIPRCCEKCRKKLVDTQWCEKCFRVFVVEILKNFR